MYRTLFGILINGIDVKGGWQCLAMIEKKYTVNPHPENKKCQHDIFLRMAHSIFCPYLPYGW